MTRSWTGFGILRFGRFALLGCGLGRLAPNGCLSRGHWPPAQRLGAVDPEDLSGRDALDLVYELNKLARKFQGDSE